MCTTRACGAIPRCAKRPLFHDSVPVAVYDNLIKAVHANLKTVYRYLDVRRKALKLKDVHIYDCYVPLAHLGKSGMPYEKAADAVCAALAPLGDDYCTTLHNGLVRQRWVDRYENQGKRSGAFSAGGYEGPPYILMNYKDDVIDSAFTLAHEAGHSMHTHYSVRNQPYQYYDYTIFVAEGRVHLQRTAAGQVPAGSRQRQEDPRVPHQPRTGRDSQYPGAADHVCRVSSTSPMLSPKMANHSL